MQKKGQASFEYLSIFGIGLALIGIVGGLFFVYTYNAKESLDFQQIDKIGSDVITNAEKIYFLGTGNRLTLKYTFPEGIENLSIHKFNESGYKYSYLNFTIVRDDNLVDVIFQTQEDYVDIDCVVCNKGPANQFYNYSYYNFSDYNMGPKTIRIESIGSKVYIDFVHD